MQFKSSTMPVVTVSVDLLICISSRLLQLYLHYNIFGIAGYSKNTAYKSLSKRSHDTNTLTIRIARTSRNTSRDRLELTRFENLLDGNFLTPHNSWISAGQRSKDTCSASILEVQQIRALN